MKIRLLFLLSMLILSGDLYAQKEYNIWYFGNHKGLDFNSSPPTLLKDSKTFCFESSSSICDSSGKLLFYTNGDTVYNRRHQVMKNGTLPDNRIRYSAMQGSMALPVPGSRNLYYLILGQCLEYSYGHPLDSLCYWLIDMSLDSGYGEVVQKEVDLLPGTLESFAVTLHANGKDYWIGSTDYNSGNFNLIRTVNGQFDKQSIISHKLARFNPIFFSEYKFSPDGRVLTANVDTIRDGISQFGDLLLYLYHFDNSTGRIYDSLVLNLGDYTANVMPEFSPDSRYLYNYCRFGKFNQTGLCQFDLYKWDAASVMNSAKYLDIAKDGVAGLQLGPDKKIYVIPVGSYTSYTSIVNIPYPNLPAPECIQGYSKIPLPPFSIESGGPYYPNFWYRDPLLELGQDTFFCEGDSVLIGAFCSDMDSFRWSHGAKSFQSYLSQPGLYWIDIFYRNSKVSDSVFISMRSRPDAKIADTVWLCQIPYIISVAVPGTYEWSDGSQKPFMQIHDSGMYWLNLTSNGCTASDTFRAERCADMLYYLPNAFSPNKDSINEHFRVIGQRFNTVRMEIYDRWGELVYSEQGASAAWDGRSSGKEVPEGVYFYRIIISGLVNQVNTKKELRGTVQLIR